MSSALESMTLAELVAHCKALRLEEAARAELPAPEPQLVPEMDRERCQTGASVVGESDGDTSWLVRGSALTAEGPARSNRARRLPDNPEFWQSLAVEYDAAHKDNPLPAEHDHKRRSNAWLWVNCADGSCLERRLRRQMTRHQPGSLLWEQARREAKRYGVDLK